MMLPAALEVVREAAVTVHGPIASQPLANAIAVVTSSDDPCAQTNLTLDPPTISISSAFMSSGSMLADALRALEEDSTDAGGNACLAVLRFYALQQVFFGVSATHGLKKINQRLTPYILFFTLAHEAGHVSAKHVMKPQEGSVQELEADSFAWPVAKVCALSRTRLAIDGALISLITADFVGKYPYIRPPSSHPTLGARIARLADFEPMFQRRADELRGLLWVANAAGDLTEPLSDEAWAALADSRSWNSGMRSASDYETARVLDKMLGLGRAELLGFLEELRLMNNPELRLSYELGKGSPARAHDLVETLSRCGISDADTWTAPDQPLGLDVIVDEFMNCPLWDELPRECAARDRVIESALAALIVRSDLVTLQGESYE
ncbi:hypothetical protein [Humibacillus xanthopallidus]|uniref:Uncharacterized protein n=1 Tax=Humibacillus xanthopallidus TaxID=412689 RepID=A0A543I3I6_9MICO|nr:hypothetical protein [Humibacillus xanthopallidus]TQM65156.1 hypothetical protein FBY41_1541 [Humibacillus xanthopallidus]